MKTCLKVLSTGMFIAAAAMAQAPTIAGVVNNYSGVAPGLPNYGIAQGSIFLIIGSNLAPSNTGLQNVPLATKLNNVSVSVTVNGTTTSPLLYYVTGTQIAAILPSKTPVGTGTVTVTTPAGTSAAAPITVVQSAFGILTVNQAGSGMGQIQNANNNYNLLSINNSAKPGDYIVLWGSGLGPVSGDESVAQSQTDFGSSMPIEVDIGGKAANTIYHGRSVYPGLDEVIAQVPDGISGCSVSVVVWHKGNNLISNTVTIPVSANGQTCSDANTGYSSTVLQKCTSSGCSTGGITIAKSTITTQPTVIPGLGSFGGGTTTTDDISASFVKYTAVQAASSGLSPVSVSSVGSCSIYTFSYNGNTPPNVPGVTATSLNAGTISATTPNTTATMTYKNGGYNVNGNGGTYIPASGGNFSFNNGSAAGADIGAFTAQTAMGAPLTSNVNNISTVTRGTPLTVTWSGGTAGTYVVVTGSSISQVGTSGTSFVGGYFWCTAPVAAGQLVVPPPVTLALPPTGSISETQSGVTITIPLPGYLGVSNSTNPVLFTAPNLDQGVLTGVYSLSNQVQYK